MEKRDFKELFREVIGSKWFLIAVIFKAVGFIGNVISGILSVPQSSNIAGTIIGTVVGNLFVLFLLILPLFEILKSKNSMNFAKDCDFALKYIRISTIILVVLSAIISVIAFLALFALGGEAVVLLGLGAFILVQSILQLEIINDLRNGLFYNIEKISYTIPYLIIAVVGFAGSIIINICEGNVLVGLTGIINNGTLVIISWILLKLNNDYMKKEL